MRDNPPAWPPLAPRSKVSVSIAIFQPSPSRPIRQSAGTRASRKNVCVKPYSPVSLRIGRVSMPGVCIGIRKYDSPS